MAMPADPTVLHAIGRGDLFDALKILNAGTPYRFTGVYTFDYPLVKNVVLFDRQSPNIEIGADVVWNDAYCRMTVADGQPLVVTDSLLDARLTGHPIRDTLRFYCGVPLRTPDDKPLGTFCHYDLAPHDPPTEAFDRLLAVRDDMQRAVWARLQLTDAPNVG
ncbi:MAG: GAF domain-containing protein [Acidobacteria bacterium]|nr:GAF domain-containing protein [Acidobacteriota bacterium]